MNEDLFVILCLERSTSRGSAFWWRPNGNGYTTKYGEAGRYMRAEAERIVNDARGGEIAIGISTFEAHTGPSFANMLTVNGGVIVYDESKTITRRTTQKSPPPPLNIKFTTAPFIPPPEPTEDIPF